MPFDKKNNPTIATYSGIEFYPLSPRAEQIKLEDIAHGLSQECRYGSQVPYFYSVAEHSVLVANLLERRYPKEIELHRWGLMHDASEAYLGDMVRPLKQKDLRYQKIEAEVMRVIAQVFKLYPLVQPEEVHKADMDIFLKEKEVLWSHTPVDWWKTEKPPLDTADYKFSETSCKEAKRNFLQTFERLFKQL